MPMYSDSSDDEELDRTYHSNGSTSKSMDKSSSRNPNSHKNDEFKDSKIKPIRTINELLRSALAKATEPGEGDEEPLDMKDPMTTKIDSDASDDVVKVRLQQLQEEEKRVAEMNFDMNAITIPSCNILERSKYIPLRLTFEERKSLRLVNSAISVSNYTNVIDVNFRNPAKRQHAQLQQIVAFLSGLVSAIDYDKGQQVLEDRNFLPHEQLIQDLLEISRRYKITNPEKMRSEYGKLIYLMQDASSESIQPLLGIKLHKPIQTVYSLLEKYKCIALLEDPLIATATEEILPEKNGNRSTIQMRIKRKESAVEKIVQKYKSQSLTSDMIRLCLYSISDNNSFLNSNKKPVEDCIQLLLQYFNPSKVSGSQSLAIHDGSNDGSRITHSHEKQFHYVHQSLVLWAAILEDTFRLWYLSEIDLLQNQNVYDLKQTGQGLQRVQPSPRVYSAMHEILASSKRKLGEWVGSSVIHLGDNNVPNALIFIDKYTQVSRILGPLVTTLSNLEKAISDNEGLSRYMNSYGGIEKAKKDILHDFFRFAFDGSGGFNDFDAGSCIDGRLTSAWNWCANISSKPYYSLFRLTGFLSFDGEFDK